MALSAVLMYRRCANYDLLRQFEPDVAHLVNQVPGVPIMYIAQHKFTIERLPEATMGGAPRR